MIVQINETFPIINKVETSSVVPVVTSIQKITDKEAITKTHFNVQYSCAINKETYRSSDCDRIDVFLSPFPIDFIREEINASLITTVIKQINDKDLDPDFGMRLVDSLQTNTTMNAAMIKYTSTLRRELISGFFKRHNIKKINSLSAKPHQLEVSFKKTLRLASNNSPRFKLNVSLIRNQISQQSEFVTARRNFKKNYNFLKKQGVDSLFLFENSYKKSSKLLHRQGSKVKTPLRLNGFDKYLKSLFDTVSSEIRLISDASGAYTPIQVAEKVSFLEGNFFTSLDSLDLLGSEAYLLFYAKDKDGLNLLSESVYFNTRRIRNQITDSSSDYNIGAIRNQNTGVSKLVIGNNSQVNNLNVTVYAKQLLNYPTPFSINSNTGYTTANLFLKLIPSVEIPPNARVKISDGSLGNTSFAQNLNDARNILYRTTLNYNNLNFDNAKSNFSKSSRFKYENRPTCVITTQVYGNRINASATSIPDNVVAYRFCKFRYSGSSRGEKLFTVDKFGNLNKSFTLKNLDSDSVSIDDYDVFDGKVYEYRLECQVDSGEVFVASSNACIEMYEKRQELFEIVQVGQLERSNTNSTSSQASYTGGLTEGDTINFSFSVNRNTPQFRQILFRLLGASRILDQVPTFKELADDLSKLIEFTYSVIVERIDKKTGEKTLVDTILFGQEGINGGVFNVSDTVNFGADICYKLTPRVKSTEKLLRIVQDLVDSLAQDSRFSTVNYAGGSTDKLKRTLSEGIISAVNDKYNNSSALKRGLIIPESIKNANSAVDMFFDASTGDVTYIESYGSGNIYGAKNLSLANGGIEEIKSINKDNNRLIRQNNFKNKIKLRSQKFELKFSANAADAAIDYYIIFVKNYEQIYIDGAIHSRDGADLGIPTNSNPRATGSGSVRIKYKYLVEHYATEGLVEYFAVPVSKKGELLSPFFLVNQFIK